MPNEFVDLRGNNVRVWCLLAFQAGAVNAGGFLACHRFVTHTTGFATHFAYELATHHEGAALGMLSVPFFFLLGAMITSYFVDLRLTHGKPANYGVPSFLIFICLALAMLLGKLGIFGLFNGEMALKEDYLLLILLTLASGLQNALITNSQGVVVRTTHLTGVTTDLAVGVVRTFFGERRKNPGRTAHDRMATFARAGIIGSFVLGSTVSAYLYLQAQYLGFAVPVFTSLFLLRYFVIRSNKKEVFVKTISLMLLALSASIAQASPEIAPPSAGTYAFNGEFNVEMKLNYNVVYAFTDKGRSELETRINDGEECWNKGRDIYLCKAFKSTDGAADLVRNRIAEGFRNKDLILAELRGDPTLVSKGTDVAEYEVPQRAIYAGKTYETYRLVQAQGNWSVRLGDPVETQFAFENGQLKMPLELPVTESHTAYSVFVVLASFLRM